MKEKKKRGATRIKGNRSGEETKKIKEKKKKKRNLEREKKNPKTKTKI